MLALAISLARAAARVGASLRYSAGGVLPGSILTAGPRDGYDGVVVVMVLLSLASGAAVMAAGDRPPAYEAPHATGEHA